MSANTYLELGAPKHESKSPNQFHQFSKLPTELRWRIWEMAFCHWHGPRIHYYSLFHTDNEGHRHSQLQQMMRDNPLPAPKPLVLLPNGKLWYKPSPPLQSRPDQFSWAMANRFQYFWNDGLRSACAESRMILCRIFAKIRRRMSEQSWQRAKARYYRSLVRTRDQEQEFCLYLPKDDILCLRFAPEDMAACASLSWEILLTRLPMFCLPLIPDFNLAFEYDESWNEGLGNTKESILELMPEASVRGLALRAYWAWLHTKLPCASRVWLIDRDARPLPKDYKLGRQNEYGGRYFLKGYIYRKCLWEPQWNHVFVDEKSKYVECYMNNGQYVPVLHFITRMRLIANPATEEFNSTSYTPCVAEYFFNVLRQLPGSG